MILVYNGISKIWVYDSQNSFISICQKLWWIIDCEC